MITDNEQQIINDLLKCNDLICMYEFGSTVYKSNDDKSDIDFILVIDTVSIFKSILSNDMVFYVIKSHNCRDKTDYNWYEAQYQFEYGNLSFNIYTEYVWERKCKDLSIDTLECAFLDKKFIYKEAKKYLDKDHIDKIQLRRSISAVVSNSWVKGKKKFIDGEDRLGYKSIFHAIRILSYGIQIYQYGEIKDYEEPTFEYYNLIKDRYEKYKSYGYNGLELYNLIIKGSNADDINLKLIMNEKKSDFKRYTENEWRDLKLAEINQ